MHVALAGGNVAHGPDDFRVCSLLEDIAGGAGCERLAHVPRIVLHGQHEHLGLGRLVEQLRQRFDPALAGHDDVEEDDIRLLGAHREHGFPGVTRLGHDFEVALGLEEEA
jgi:hypothetical protein